MSSLTSAERAGGGGGRGRGDGGTGGLLCPVHLPIVFDAKSRHSKTFVQRNSPAPRDGPSLGAGELCWTKVGSPRRVRNKLLAGGWGWGVRMGAGVGEGISGTALVLTGIPEVTQIRSVDEFVRLGLALGVSALRSLVRYITKSRTSHHRSH